MTSQKGFTIVELLVAISVFITTLVVILDIYSSIVALNIKTQAATRASEEIRNFMEALVKDIRDARIHYNQNDPSRASYTWTTSVPCTNSYAQGGDFKLALSKKLDDGSVEQVCYFLSNSASTIWPSTSIFNTSDYPYLSVVKQVDSVAYAPQIMNPSTDHFSIEFLRFYVYPLSNPYATTGTIPDIEPFITILARFKVKLPGQTDVQAIEIPYQTTVSSDVYDIP